MKIVAWKCLVCGGFIKGDENLKDGTRCLKCGGILEPREIKHDILTVSVDVKGLEPFKRFLSVMGEFALDERIPESIRMEYVDRIITSVRT